GRRSTQSSIIPRVIYPPDVSILRNPSLSNFNASCKRKKINSLQQALSYVPPPAIYQLDASISMFGRPQE
ncbi:26662_t:CDS:1, partial [Dentiscutata erythropus]